MTRRVIEAFVQRPPRPAATSAVLDRLTSRAPEVLRLLARRAGRRVTVPHLCRIHR